MEEVVVPTVLFIMFFGVIGYVTRVISDNRVRRELMQINPDKDTIDFMLLRAREENPETSLKWGIVTVAIGVSLALIHMLGLSEDEALSYALVFIFGGAGLLVHYAMRSAGGSEA